MSFNYRHISKAGGRIMERLNNPPKYYARKNELEKMKGLPAFLRPDIMPPPEDKLFKTERDWKFLPGDRVVIMAGECKGNIATIKERDTSNNGYLLDENGPMREIVVPKAYWQEGQTSHVISMPKTMTQKDLRLVADIDDETNPGQVKTVAVDRIVFKGSYYDKSHKKVLPYRCVYGNTDLVIPWPKREAKEDGPLATSPEVVREQTFWVDSIVKKPIPTGALLTLRNPHSKYRKRKLTARDLKKLVAPRMPLSDTKKAFLAEREEMAKRERPQLTEEDMNMIGERVRKFLESKKKS